MNVCGRVHLILPVISPNLEISVPSSFHSRVNRFLSLEFHPFIMVDIWGADLVLLKPAAELFLSYQDLKFIHLPILLGELDSAPVDALRCC